LLRTYCLGFAYDALGRNISQSGPLGTLSYGYDAAGRRISMGYPAIAGASALTLSYDYDSAGNVTAIRENGATSGSGVLASYGYDALGRRASLTYGISVTQSYSFDGTQRLASIASNLAGNAQDVTASFTYNPASQLDTVSKNSTAYAYTPIPAQDVVSAANGLNQLTAATPGAGQTSVPTLSYDARGNLTGIGSAAYGYSSENLLKTGPGGVTLDYDPAMRLAKIASGGPATRFAYDGTDLIAEYAGGEAPAQPAKAYSIGGIAPDRITTHPASPWPSSAASLTVPPLSRASRYPALNASPAPLVSTGRSTCAGAMTPPSGNRQPLTPNFTIVSAQPSACQCVATASAVASPDISVSSSNVGRPMLARAIALFRAAAASRGHGQSGAR
jgi:YD repeat-containing protein